MKKYNHLTAEQRYTIDVLLRQKKSRKEICEIINISQSTLCRELKRNSGQRGYLYQQAQVKADKSTFDMVLEMAGYPPLGSNLETVEAEDRNDVKYYSLDGRELCDAPSGMYIELRSNRAIKRLAR